MTNEALVCVEHVIVSSEYRSKLAPLVRRFGEVSGVEVAEVEF